jgi:hypothetical protein
MKSEIAAQYSLYVHVYSCGKVYLFPSNRKHGFKSDTEALQKEIRYAEQMDGIILYSLEDNADLESSGVVSSVLFYVDHARIPTQLVDAHPEVNGYSRSFAPYLNEALEVAEIDVEGLRGQLRDARRILRNFTRGTMEFQRQRRECGVLHERLKIAKRCLERLSALYFELCVKAEEIH